MSRNIYVPFNLSAIGVTVLFLFGYNSLGQVVAEETPESAPVRRSVQVFTEAILHQNKEQIRSALSVRDKQEADLADAYVGRVMSYRSLILSAVREFPRNKESLSIDLKGMTDDVYARVLAELPSANVEVNASSATVVIEQGLRKIEIHSLRRGDRWQISTYSLFGLGIEVERGTVSDRATSQRELTEVALVACQRIEEHQFATMQDAMKFFDSSRMAILSKHRPGTLGTTRPFVSTRPSVLPNVVVEYAPRVFTQMSYSDDVIAASYSDNSVSIIGSETGDVLARFNISGDTDGVPQLFVGPMSTGICVVCYRTVEGARIVEGVDWRQNRLLWREFTATLDALEVIGWLDDGRSLAYSMRTGGVGFITATDGSSGVLIQLPPAMLRDGPWWQRLSVSGAGKSAAVLANGNLMGLEILGNGKNREWSIVDRGLTLPKPQPGISSVVVVEEGTSGKYKTVNTTDGVERDLVSLGSIISIGKDGGAFISSPGVGKAMLQVSASMAKPVDISRLAAPDSEVRFSTSGKTFAAYSPLVDQLKGTSPGKVILGRQDCFCNVVDCASGELLKRIDLIELPGSISPLLAPKGKEMNELNGTRTFKAK